MAGVTGAVGEVGVGICGFGIYIERKNITKSKHVLYSKRFTPNICPYIYLLGTF